ncbi:MAG TPA: Nif3-like dinuclear metal center hexameric protein [Polyangiaceae bacterium]|nr:Nif3-like dinuclear metal center hexameric protein [Polyangiaceae bacterium]
MPLPLTELLQVLDQLAPLRLAEDWDNVGLLIDPRESGRELPISRLLLTIDATPTVVSEAESLRAQCLLSYHPPLFRAKKRFSRAEDPVVFAAAHAGFAVYSPHTALDAAPSGLTDWLAEGAGSGRLTALVPALTNEGGSTAISPPGHEPSPAIGAGRLLELDQPTPLGTILERLKQHLGLTQVRLAASAAHDHGASIRRIAFCAGSGGSLFERATADLFVTGELGHHAVLAKLAQGQSVILCEHSNTERGYLPRYRQRLLDATRGEIEVLIAAADREPLQIV